MTNGVIPLGKHCNSVLNFIIFTQLTGALVEQDITQGQSTIGLFSLVSNKSAEGNSAIKKEPKLQRAFLKEGVIFLFIELYLRIVA